MNIYDFSAKSISGDEVSLGDFKGKAFLVVNTASKCGFTPQYEDLEKIYEKYKAQGFEILGFPSNQFADQEPGTNEEVKNFCQLNYGVSFPLFTKTEVRGVNADPLFKYLTSEAGFKGFNLEHPLGKILDSLLKEKFPEFLGDDSIKWNFTKFLVDRDGNVVERFEPTTTPFEIEDKIKSLL